MQQGLDKQTIIDLAKKQYEQTRHLRIPPVVVKLPSNGLVYPESSPLRSGVVEMRHMTAYDEDILSNSSYIQNNVVFDKLLESLVVTPNVNADDIIMTDREKLIITARILGYGNIYPVTVVDPKTNKELKREIDLSKIANRPFSLTPDANGEFDYVISETGDKLKFRFLAPKQTKSLSDDHPVSAVLEASICEVNGDRNATTISDFIKFDFGAGLSRTFRKYMIDNIPGLDFNVQFEGEDGSTFEAGFQFGIDLFWF